MHFEFAPAKSTGQSCEFGIELKVEVVERFVGIAEAGLFATAFQQPVGTPGELVIDESRQQIDGSHGLHLRLMQTRFQYGGHAADRY